MKSACCCSRKDASTAESLLTRVGISCTVCHDIEGICEEIGKGAAAILMAEEALGSPNSSSLDDCLAGQPQWSDCPIIILTRGGFDSTVAAKALETLGNVTLVERPVRVPTLVSAVRTAIRSRQRQYLIREYLAERELTEKALREKEERLRLIMENVHDHAIYTLDVDGNISSWNIGAERVFGYTQDAILGKAGHTVFSPDGKCDGRALKEIRICGERGRATSEGWLFRKDGSRFWADGSMEPIRAKNGELKGFVRIVSDRTQRKRTEEKLRDNDRRKDEFLAMLAHELRNPLLGHFQCSADRQAPGCVRSSPVGEQRDRDPRRPPRAHDRRSAGCLANHPRENQAQEGRGGHDPRHRLRRGNLAAVYGRAEAPA